MENRCRFCAVSENQQSFGVADTKLASDGRYFAIPSIGSLVEGWTLIVPNEHCVSLRAHYGSSNFGAFVSDIAGKVRDAYGSVIAFEHGANHEGSATGCGTDHAHLHIVPFDGIDVEDLDSSGIVFHMMNVADIAQVVGSSEYLAFFPDIAANPTHVRVAILDASVSQFFRRLIGYKLGLSAEEMDYHKSPRLDVASATAMALMPVFETAAENE
ncbi:HIT family protein [Candidimonas nitroreducens]|uniref:HIT domain-containing protein n=1 Tax=Candidimonas nitroreducens TaxID=683354 RepID=A0A225M4G9_9BURK|nr:hypothetical protein [Candidimonas nitroreducens]OWT56197.1 hypothetical protein CEY11_19425 [Candidimonas nitroreducens]